MGLRMDDLHAPTVPSGPASGTANGIAKDKLSLRELIAEKDRVESELKALGSVLESHGVNMNTSLTTFDGFPRSDIDVAQIRTIRARIIPLKNDYKDLMKRIEVGLHEHHAALAASGSDGAQGLANTISSRPNDVQSGVEPSSSDSTSTPFSVDAPFAKVNGVVPGSPAEDAGLVAGDKITRFGTVNWMNHEKLSKVAQVVQQNEGRVINVKVLRTAPATLSTTTLEMQLTPRRDWGGRGLLGCHLVPI